MINNRPRTNAGRTGLTMYYIDGGASVISILNTEWGHHGLTQETLGIVILVVIFIVLAANKYIRQPVQRMVFKPVCQTIMLNTNTGSIFRLIVDTASARNFAAAPLFPTNGQIITIIFINGLGGTLSLTLDAIYQLLHLSRPLLPEN